MSFPYEQKLIPRARELRKNMTRQERRLWYDLLRRLPVRFQRQKSTGGYILDFYCHEARLAIELDGGQHYTAEEIEYDAKRTAQLERFGLKIIRYSNADIDKNFPAVCEDASRQVKARIDPQSPIPEGAD